MHAVFSESHRRHRPTRFLRRGEWAEYPEVPERAENLLAASRALDLTVVAPDDFGPGPRQAVHTAAHLGFLESANRRWRELDGASDYLLPNVHPGRHTPGHQMAGYPAGVVGQAGWHIADLACPVGPESWEAACAAANVALHAASLVLDGANAAYGICRPPGHHALADVSGGFCLLNNVAIAAQHMLGRLERVAILDIDVHHGNGTQGIFYQRGEVLFVSLHCDPADFYPFFAGYAVEGGAGDGEGANLNLPLVPGSGDETFLAAIADGLAGVRAHDPGALLISLGFDAFKDDPLSGLTVSTDGFRAAGRGGRRPRPAHGADPGGRLRLRRARRQPHRLPRGLWP